MLLDPYDKTDVTSTFPGWSKTGEAHGKALELLDKWHTAKVKALSTPDINTLRTCPDDVLKGLTDFTNREFFLAALETTSVHWADWSSNGAVPTQRRVIRDYMYWVSYAQKNLIDHLGTLYVNDMRHELHHVIKDAVKTTLPNWTWWDGLSEILVRRCEYTLDKMTTLLVDNRGIVFRKLRTRTMHQVRDLLLKDSALGINANMDVKATIGKNNINDMKFPAQYEGILEQLFDVSFKPILRLSPG